MKKTEIWSFIGAGGKSTLILRTAEKKSREGRRVLVTTTTHMAFTEKDLVSAGGCLLTGNDGELAAAVLAEKSPVAAGRPADEPGKMQGLSADELRKAMAGADLVLTEADGSRRHPFKAPGPHEPAVFPGSRRIILVAGLTALGCPPEKSCHRPGEITALTGRSPDSPLTCGDMARVIRSGYLKKCREQWPEIPVTVILNQADTDRLRENGMQVAELLTGSGAEVYLFSARAGWKGKERWNMN